MFLQDPEARVSVLGLWLVLLFGEVLEEVHHWGICLWRTYLDLHPFLVLSSLPVYEEASIPFLHMH